MFAMVDPLKLPDQRGSVTLMVTDVRNCWKTVMLSPYNCLLFAINKMFSLMCSKKPKHDITWHLPWKLLFKGLHFKVPPVMTKVWLSIAMDLNHVLWWACGEHAPARSWNLICIGSLNHPLKPRSKWRKPVSSKQKDMNNKKSMQFFAASSLLIIEFYYVSF